MKYLRFESTDWDKNKIVVEILRKAKTNREEVNCKISPFQNAYTPAFACLLKVGIFYGRLPLANRFVFIVLVFRAGVLVEKNIAYLEIFIDC